MKNLRNCAAAVLALLAMSVAHAQQLHTFESASLARIVAAHQGRPFVLLLWSMDCEFCQASLETLSKIRAKQADFDIVTISTDSVSDTALAGQTRDRLASLGLLQDAWIFSADAPERLRFAIDPRWHGEKPRSYWFDAAGHKTAHSGVITAQLVKEMRVR